MQTSKLVLPFIEMMATQVCNLRCYGCSNYSELQNKDYLAWDQAKAQIKPWLEIFDLPDFGIIIGEPLINPKINKWILGIRDLPDFTYEEISGFVDNFGLPHQRCWQCPTKHDTAIDHATMVFTQRQSAEMISNISV